LDFPEFGKAGGFDKTMYNSFCQNRHFTRMYDVSSTIDGKYHTYTTDWHTKLVELDGVTDKQVVESEGFWWVQDKSVSFDRYLGNPLKRLGKDRYAAYMGDKAVHWIDGRKVAETTVFVPSMAAQLNLGIWLPKWAGPAPWKTAHLRIASVKIWQFNDPGDVRGVIKTDISNSFDKKGRVIGH
jgi:hypothetical protein